MRDVFQGVITSYAIPPHAPKAVAAADERFCAAADRYGQVLGEIADLEEERAQAIADAKRAAVDAALAGGAVATVGATTAEREYDEKLTAKRLEAEALLVAVDELGDLRARAIGEHLDEYLAAQLKIEQDAATRLAAGLATCREALADMAPARGAVRWLSEYDTSDVLYGRSSQFAGGRCDVDASGAHLDSFTPPERLLDLLAQVLDGEPGEPAPRRVDAARETK